MIQVQRPFWRKFLGISGIVLLLIYLAGMLETPQRIFAMFALLLINGFLGASWALITWLIARSLSQLLRRPGAHILPMAASLQWVQLAILFILRPPFYLKFHSYPPYSFGFYFTGLYPLWAAVSLALAILSLYRSQQPWPTSARWAFFLMPAFLGALLYAMTTLPISGNSSLVQ
jgi:hypothetical protein